jgi:hypothetical protein
MSIPLAHVLLWAIVVLLGAITWGLMQELHSLRERFLHTIPGERPELPVGGPVPAFEWIDAWSGRRIENNQLAGRITLLVFLSNSCPTCSDVPGSLTEVLSHDTRLQVIVVCSGKENDCKYLCHALRGTATVVCDSGSEIRSRFAVSSYPTTIVADRFGKVRAVTHAVRAQDFRNVLAATNVTRAAAAI